VLLLYGVASALFSYLISLSSKSQLAAFAFSAGGQAVLFFIYIVVFFEAITGSVSSNIESKANIAHFLLALVVPICSIARALLVALSFYAISCHGENLVSY
jgi:ATP-binding cassette, subfamily A (ABC1), member 3